MARFCSECFDLISKEQTICEACEDEGVDSSKTLKNKDDEVWIEVESPYKDYRNATTR